MVEAQHLYLRAVGDVDVGDPVAAGVDVDEGGVVGERQVDDLVARDVDFLEGREVGEVEVAREVLALPFDFGDVAAGDLDSGQHRDVVGLQAELRAVGAAVVGWLGKEILQGLGLALVQTLCETA